MNDDAVIRKHFITAEGYSHTPCMRHCRAYVVYSARLVCFLSNKSRIRHTNCRNRNVESFIVLFSASGVQEPSILFHDVWMSNAKSCVTHTLVLYAFFCALLIESTTCSTLWVLFRILPKPCYIAASFYFLAYNTKKQSNRDKAKDKKIIPEHTAKIQGGACMIEARGTYAFV
jgi:hypothetical protein